MIPQPLPNPNYKRLVKECDYFLTRIYEGASIDEVADNERLLFETLLAIIYGKNVWKWIDDNRPENQ